MVVTNNDQSRNPHELVLGHIKEGKGSNVPCGFSNKSLKRTSGFLRHIITKFGSKRQQVGLMEVLDEFTDGVNDADILPNMGTIMIILRMGSNSEHMTIRTLLVS